MAGQVANFNIDIIWSLDLIELPAQTIKPQDEGNSWRFVNLRSVNRRCAIVHAVETVGQAIVPCLGQASNFGHVVNSPEEANKGRREGGRQRQVFDEFCDPGDDLIRLIEGPKLANEPVKGNFREIGLEIAAHA